MTPFRIMGWGSYRPRRIRHSSEFDETFGKQRGWTEREFGIRERGVAETDETSSMMGAEAAKEALNRAGWGSGEFDVLIGACGVMEQPIPSTSVLIQRQLGLGAIGIPTFDVNQSCLSFVTALDVAAMGIKAGRWRRVLLVSSDIASAGLDLSTPRTASIFGDGAAAVALEAKDVPSGTGLLASRFETYGDGSELATLRTGGTRVRVEEGLDVLVEGSRFRMDAFGVFKAAARFLPGLIDGVLKDADLTRATVDHVICHQASAVGLEHARRLFAPASHKVVDIFRFTGNQIAASVPTVLAHALDQAILRTGETALLIGTSAGVSVGAVVLRL